jgi:hypothetical protein
MAAVTGGVVDQDNSTSKRQSHEITAREGYVSTVLRIGNSTSKITLHPFKRQSHKITVRKGKDMCQQCCGSATGFDAGSDPDPAFYSAVNQVFPSIFKLSKEICNVSIICNDYITLKYRHAIPT